MCLFLCRAACGIIYTMMCHQISLTSTFHFFSFLLFKFMLVIQNFKVVLSFTNILTSVLLFFIFNSCSWFLFYQISNCFQFHLWIHNCYLLFFQIWSFFFLFWFFVLNSFVGLIFIFKFLLQFKIIGCFLI